MSSKALGLIETIGLAAAIEAADTAGKAANITLLGYENSKGGGMITVKLVGDVGAVKAAVAAGAAAAQRVGKIAATHIIPRPHTEIEPLLNAVTRGKQLQPKEDPPKATKPKRAAKPKGTRRRTTKSNRSTKKAETKPATPPKENPEESNQPPPSEDISLATE